MVERYLSISQFTDPRYWDIGTAEYKVAFQSIQTTLINKLDRGQRSNLANRIFHILLDANVTSLAKTAEHTELLAKLVTLPNRSMDLLTSVHESPSVGPRQAREEAALFSLATRIDGVVRWSADNLRAVDALKRLTHSVMRYDELQDFSYEGFDLFIIVTYSRRSIRKAASSISKNCLSR